MQCMWNPSTKENKLYFESIIIYNTAGSLCNFLECLKRARKGSLLTKCKNGVLITILSPVAKGGLRWTERSRAKKIQSQQTDC